MQMGFYFDQTRCTACFTCIVACKDWNNISAGPVSWRKVITIERGGYPDLLVSFLSLSCFHCAEPACMLACPVKAISKRAYDGLVLVDSDRCLGVDCGLCAEACPYDAPQFGVEEDARMQKCDFCADRLAEGEKPACIAACPNRAMDAGPLDELRDKYGDITEADGFRYCWQIKPSILFKPKHGKRMATSKIEVAPFSQRLSHFKPD